MQEQNLDYTDQEIELILQATLSGIPLGEIAGIDPEVLEGLYGLAYNLYVSQNYKDAASLFEALCVYKHDEYRFIMGFAACKQALADYQGAIDTYGIAVVLTKFENPEPFYHSVYCLLKLEQLQDAIDMLKTIPTIGEEGNAVHDGFKAKAADLLKQLTADA